MFIVLNHWSGSRPRTHHHHWTLTKTPLKYPALAPSHVDSAAVLPQTQPLHTLQRVISGEDVRVGQPNAQDVGLGDS